MTIEFNKNPTDFFSTKRAKHKEKYIKRQILDLKYENALDIQKGKMNGRM